MLAVRRPGRPPLLIASTRGHILQGVDLRLSVEVRVDHGHSHPYSAACFGASAANAWNQKFRIPLMKSPTFSGPVRTSTD